MDGDLISRKALLEKTETIYAEVDNVIMAASVVTRTDIVMAPAVDAEPVKYGRIVEDWKDRKKGTIKRVFTCCNTDFTDLTQWMRPRYCPDCGAKIEGETERKWLSQES